MYNFHYFTCLARYNVQLSLLYKCSTAQSTSVTVLQVYHCTVYCQHCFTSVALYSVHQSLFTSLTLCNVQPSLLYKCITVQCTSFTVYKFSTVQGTAVTFLQVKHCTVYRNRVYCFSSIVLCTVKLSLFYMFCTVHCTAVIFVQVYHCTLYSNYCITSLALYTVQPLLYYITSLALYITQPLLCYKYSHVHCTVVTVLQV